MRKLKLTLATWGFALLILLAPLTGCLNDPAATNNTTTTTNQTQHTPPPTNHTQPNDANDSTQPNDASANTSDPNRSTHNDTQHTNETPTNRTNTTTPPTNQTNTTQNVTIHLTVETNQTAQAGLDPGENSDLPGTAACNVTVPAGSNGGIVLEAANQTGCIEGWRADSFDEGGRFIVMIDQLEAPGYTCLAYQAGVCDFWQHWVNGAPASYGIDSYQAQDGDHVRWLYRNTA